MILLLLCDIDTDSLSAAPSIPADRAVKAGVAWEGFLQEVAGHWALREGKNLEADGGRERPNCINPPGQAGVWLSS